MGKIPFSLMKYPGTVTLRWPFRTATLYVLFWYQLQLWIIDRRIIELPRMILLANNVFILDSELCLQILESGVYLIVLILRS